MTTTPDNSAPKVLKTPKLYLGGAFVRSESGRTYTATATDGTFLGNVPMSSRKDLRDAVVAARKAFAGWAGRTAYNRGQILYRVAEMLEGRAAEMADLVAASDGLDDDAASREVALTVERVVYYAGWTDKIAQVVGSSNPVQGSYFNVSTPEPTGIVGVVAPQESSLLGLVSVIFPALAGGNVVVAIASQQRPLPALALGEVLATSDVPAGVVNLLSGVTAELATPLADHRDVNALDLVGASAELATDLAVGAADSTKRLVSSTVTSPVWHTAPTTRRMRDALELKTVWHPSGR